jgi:hypothetical protein
MSAVMYSGVFFLVSLILSAAYSTVVPRQYGGPAVVPPPGREYTPAELERAARASKERMEALRRELANQDPRERMRELTDHALSVLWIPWLVAPFFFRLRGAVPSSMLLSVPLFVLLLQLISLEAFLTMSGVCVLGFIARFLWAKVKHAT